LITFDWQGISGHINHIAIERSVRHMLATSPRVSAINLPTYTLTTVPIIRKYSSFIDIFFSVPIRYILGSSLEREDDNILIVSSFTDYRRAVHAMRQHASQMVWFRHLYITFSRYMLINTLKRVG
jgi:N-acetylglucosaminylphosphatidylinositol deacetylase